VSQRKAISVLLAAPTPDASELWVVVRLLRFTAWQARALTVVCQPRTGPTPCREAVMPQATRLVKNSLIAIEQTDVDVDDPEAAAEEDALAAEAEARRPDGDGARAGDSPTRP